MPIKKSSKETIWIGIIPGIWGVGLAVAEKSEKACMTALKRTFLENRKYWLSTTPFQKAYEDWGGSVSEVEIGKGYGDDFTF